MDIHGAATGKPTFSWLILMGISCREKYQYHGSNGKENILCLVMDLQGCYHGLPAGFVWWFPVKGGRSGDLFVVFTCLLVDLSILAMFL